MSNFAVIRLGKDSVADIQTIDDLHQSPAAPVTFTVQCKQVPSELVAGAYAFFCFGSDNSQGAPTAWVRGVRAFGTIVSKTGGPGYNDQWNVAVEIRVVLPQTVTRRDLLAHAPSAYFWSSGIPVIGIEANSQQTILLIKQEETDQNVAALMYGIASHSPVFKTDTIKAYPELASLFEYEPASPAAPAPLVGGIPFLAGDDAFKNLVGNFQAEAKKADLHVDPGDVQRLVASLLSKRFLIATGLAGSGKTKLAQAFARWITPSSSYADPFVPGKSIEGASKSYLITAADQLGVEFTNDKGVKVLLPRAIIEQWANFIEQNVVPDSIPSQELRDQIKEAGGEYSDSLQNFETHYKPAAFALLKARAGSVAAKCYEVVPVGADWTGNENVLGYPDGLRPPKLKADGSVDEPGSYVTKPTLELILQAKDHPDIPHLIILDEMNLSHVERYFADILSVIESEESIQLHNDVARKAIGREVPKEVALPKNLFIIGTVNVDETTYMFSPKVLDRANVIEFRMDAGEMKGFLGNPAKPDLEKLNGKGALFGKAFVDAAKGPAEIPTDVQETYQTEMLLFFNALRGHGAEFGYRVAHEAARFVHFYKLLGNYPAGDTSWFSEAFDCVALQKFLPKLHGSRAKLGPILKNLWFLCVSDAAKRGSNPLKAAEEAARSTEKRAEPLLEVPPGAPYPRSAEKIGRMWRLLNENGFASFAEA